jgi:Sigma-70 region 2
MAESVSGAGWLAGEFEHLRPHLASVAYGMLGSVTEAEDAVQQAWLRLGRSDAGAIIDMRAWLTTVVGRICLDMLRARKAHRVEYVGAWLPEPLVEEPAADGPEQQAMMLRHLAIGRPLCGFYSIPTLGYAFRNVHRSGRGVRCPAALPAPTGSCAPGPAPRPRRRTSRCRRACSSRRP